MKIYTKTGDAGVTGLFGGDRVPKDAIRIEAYGEVDELNAVIGMVRASQPPADIDRLLVRIQNDLFVVGADLATPLDQVLSRVPRIDTGYAEALEKEIDALDAKLPPLKNFVLPGGTSAAALLHFARTVCRRAERAVVTLARAEKIGPEIIIYLNRLSDLLFVLARYANHRAGSVETNWSGSAEK
ncbi:MAG: cob(I)yrinic acid a,c-diamide adenosyltransferase [Ignavibacteriales bacterium]|nr:cob(I)yrinic acid a,c-diamide adenosyltransferase [Ignavibacteriales bacterium]